MPYILSRDARRAQCKDISVSSTSFVHKGPPKARSTSSFTPAPTHAHIEVLLCTVLLRESLRVRCMECAQRDCERKLSRKRRYASSEPSSNSLDLELVDMADECEDDDDGSV